MRNVLRMAKGDLVMYLYKRLSSKNYDNKQENSVSNGNNTKIDKKIQDHVIHEFEMAEKKLEQAKKKLGEAGDILHTTVQPSRIAKLKDGAIKTFGFNPE